MLGSMNGIIVFLVLIVLLLNISLHVDIHMEEQLNSSISSGIFSQVSLRQKEYQEPNTEEKIHNKDELNEEVKELLMQDLKIVLEEDLQEEAKVVPQQQVLQQNFTFRTATTPKYNTTSITIIQCWTGIILPWMERAININEAYAKLHGYSYELLTSDSIVSAHKSHINKIKILRNRLQLANSTDILLYMDMDCVVWNQTVTVDSFPIDRYDFILPGLKSIFACSPRFSVVSSA